MAFIWYLFDFRLLWSVLPRPGATMDFLRRSIRPKPDLYGPFWVCVTLIFSVAISGKITNIVMVTKKQSQIFPVSYDVTTFISLDYTGNVAQYLQTAVQPNSATGFRWHYDFHKVRTCQQHHELNSYILYFSVYAADLIQNSISF